MHQHQEVLEILHHVAGPTSVNMECEACTIYEQAGTTQEVLYMERWKSLAALHRHIQSPMFINLLSVMEMSTVRPEIHFYEIAQSWGLELVKTMRSPKETGQTTEM